MAPVAERTRPTKAEHLANDIFCYVNYAALQQAAHARQRVMKESRTFYEKMILQAIHSEQGENNILEYLEQMYEGKTEAHIMHSFVMPFFTSQASA